MASLVKKQTFIHTTKGISLLYLNKNIILLQLIVIELPIMLQALFKGTTNILSNLIFTLILSYRYCYYLDFIDKEAEGQRGEITCPRSHN